MILLCNKKYEFFCYDHQFRSGININKCSNRTFLLEAGLRNRRECIKNARRLAIRHKCRIVDLNIISNRLKILPDGIIRCKGPEEQKYDRIHINRFVLFDCEAPFDRCNSQKDQNEIMIELVAENNEMPFFERLQFLSLLKLKIDFEMGKLREKQDKLNKKPKIRVVKSNV